MEKWERIVDAEGESTINPSGKLLINEKDNVVGVALYLNNKMTIFKSDDGVYKRNENTGIIELKKKGDL